MKKGNKKGKGNSIIDERGVGRAKKLCVGQNKRCLPTHLVRHTHLLLTLMAQMNMILIMNLNDIIVN